MHQQTKLMSVMNSWLGFITANKISIATFLAIGTITTTMYFVIFGLLWNILQINYVFDVTVAYGLSTTFHFLANRRLTFKSADGDLAAQLKKYLVMIALNYLITLLIVSVVVEWVHFSPYIGILTSVCVTIFTTYLISHFWVFTSSLSYSRR